MTKAEVTTVVKTTLGTILGKPEADIDALMDKDMVNDLGMTSLDLFPFLSEIEDKCDMDIDYNAFLTEVHTPTQAIEFITK